MINVVMHGCNGKMGQVISEIVSKDDKLKMVAGVDKFDDGHNSYPVFSDINELPDGVDVIIDFSAAPAVDGLLDYCEKKSIPVVLCTTGLSKEQLERVKAVSEKVAVLKSANMSLGINLLMKILTQYAPILADNGFDIEVVEKHHRLKLDAPSGTAIALADAVNGGFSEGDKYEYVYDRSERRMQRPDKEIGISAVRGGTIVGDHDVIFAGQDEVVTFSHTAYSKALFGRGAVSAAKFLAGKSAGLYDMSNVIDELIG
ncbi:MAG: 4-hydroxy-tetrahydrodipicolinate reductase [Lachnospiraceae bacterium]|nr:4-hydroxy-tetrahydrodipicolinate reductase [Lachnospiraceae bacterium]